eukprot:Gb_40713 [translate_table: standard]
MGKKVGIVGAGVSGLVACKHLLQRGFEPVVFEAQESIGGQWRQTCASTKLQTPRAAFQFSDFPWPPQVTAEYPTHLQVMDYFHAYAIHFNLLPSIRFNSRVVEIKYLMTEGLHNLSSAGLWGHTGEPFNERESVWEIRVQNINNLNSIEVHRFDFLILCIGRFGEEPRLHTFPADKGPQIFQGKVVHSMDYSALDDQSAYDLVKGKRVVVIGFQKSALDIAAECANANFGENGIPCTMIYRSVHWAVPNYVPWGVHIAYLYCTRFSEMLVHKPGEGFLLSALATLLAPMRWAVSKFVESYLLWKLPLRKYGLIPEHSFLQQISSCQLSTLPDDFYSKVEEGAIVLRKSVEWNFFRKGIVVDDGTEIEADVIILGTGYDGDKKLKDLLPKSFSDLLLDSTGLVPLYRGCIHPRIPHMAILGYPESLSNLHSSEIRSQWLAYLLAGKFGLPSINEMRRDISRWVKYMKNSTPFYWRACIGALHIWHNDQLCIDMGWNPKRKKNWFQELFSPYSNMDYREE